MRLDPLQKGTAVSWLVEVALTSEGSEYTVLDITDLVQEYMDVRDFSALPVKIKNRTVQSSAAVRDEALTLFFPAEPAVVLFHRETQNVGERLEVY